MNKSPGMTHFLLLTGIALIWGSQFYFNQIVIQSLPPLTLAAGRASIGALTLALLARCLPAHSRGGASQRRGQWGIYALLAFFEALLPMFLLSWGQTRVDSSIAAILMGTIPLFTVLLAPAFVGGKHWGAAAIISVICGFAGILILLGPNLHSGSQGNLLGDYAVLGAAASVSVSLLLFNRLDDTPAVIAVRNILAMAALPLLLLSLLLDQPWTLKLTLSAWGSLLVLGIFCAGIVYLMLARLIRLAGSVYTSLVNYLTPLVGVLIGAVVANETVAINAWLALLFIIAALLIQQRQPRLRHGDE
jgi:drug/metabolite transporter (DMT)-like permease